MLFLDNLQAMIDSTQGALALHLGRLNVKRRTFQEIASQLQEAEEELARLQNLLRALNAMVPPEHRKKEPEGPDEIPY